MRGQLRQYPLRIGVEEGFDPKQSPPSSLKTGTNVWPDKPGRVRKRFGTTLLSNSVEGGAVISNAGRFITRVDGVSLCDKRIAYSYHSQTSSWVQLDTVPNLTVTSRPVGDSTRSAVNSAVVVVNDFLITAYVAGYTLSGPIYIRVDSLSTGDCVLIPSRVVAEGSWPLLTSASSSSVEVWWTNASGELVRASLDLTDPVRGNLTSGTTLETGLVANSIFDAVLGTGSISYAIYSVTGPAVRVARFSVATKTHDEDFAVSPQAASVAIIAPAGERVYAAFGFASAVRLGIFALADLTPTTAFTVIEGVPVERVGLVRANSTTCILAYTETALLGAGTQNVTRTVLANSTAAVSNASNRGTCGVVLLSKPWVGADSRFYVAVSTDEIAAAARPDTSHAVVEIETSSNESLSDVPHRHVATLESRTATLNASNRGTFPGFYVTQVSTDANSRVHLAVPFKTSSVILNEPVTTGVNVYSVELPSVTTDTFRSSVIGKNAVLTAGAPASFDGSNSFPMGFLKDPTILTATANNTANAGNMANGTYLYKAVYEWRDANGVLHRSAPSPSISATVAAAPGTGGKVTLAVQTATLSGKQNLTTGFGTNSASPVRVAVYRTTVGGSIFYRLTHEPDVNTLDNNPRTHTVSFADTRSDSNIGGDYSVALTLSQQPQIYTDQELDEIAPNGFVTQIQHKGRIWGIGPDRRTLWASKDVREDPSVFPGFNEALTLYLDDDKYALGALDERLVVLGKSTVDLLAGNGPDANGLQNDWQVYRVQTDSGCEVPRSVVTTPLGLAYLSTHRSFDLLGRDFTVAQIGTSVEDTLASYPVVTSAVLVPRDSQVRWTCIESDGTNGVVIVWDYAVKFWAVWRYYDTATSTQDVAFVDAALIDGVWTAVTAGGRVYKESTSTHLDGGTQYVETDIVLNDIAEAGPNGWKRVKSVQIAGESRSNHRLDISVARDFASSYERTESFAAGSDATEVSTLEKARVTLVTQKLQAVRVRIQDKVPANTTTHPVGTGEGAIVSGVSFYVKPKQGPAKASANRRG